VQGHCTKPVKESVLLRTVHSALRSRASPTPPDSPGAQPTKPLNPSAKLHVLLAEDNAVNQAVARALLAKWGHTLEIAATGKATVELNKEDRFDLILMDVSSCPLRGSSILLAESRQ
jgi:two-component system sensor histidine kinase/response regulator